MFTVRTDHFLNSLIARPLLLGNVSLVSLRPTTITMVDEKIKADGNWASRPYVGISSPQNRPIPLDFSRKFTNNSSFKKQGNFEKIIPVPNILSGSNHSDAHTPAPYQRTQRAKRASITLRAYTKQPRSSSHRPAPYQRTQRAKRASIVLRAHTVGWVVSSGWVGWFCP